MQEQKIKVPMKNAFATGSLTGFMIGMKIFGKSNVNVNDTIKTSVDYMKLKEKIRQQEKEQNEK